MPSEFPEYRVDRLSPYNLSALEALFAAVYGRKPPAGYFANKYDTGYTGAAYLGFIAFNQQDTPVAYYGVMPCELWYDGRIVLAAQSGDTMTHPDFRYKGMFIELSRLTFELCKLERVNLLFGFPNQNSYHGAITKLGWQQTETMDCFIIPVRTLPLAAAAKGASLLRKIYQSYSWMIFGCRVRSGRELCNSVIEDGYNGLLRSERYMSYRKYSDNRVLQIGAAVVWVKTDGDLVIGDLLLGGADFGRTVAALKRLAFLLGLRRILFHSSPGTRLHRLFSGSYPMIPSFPVLFQDLDSGLSPETIKFTFADIDIF